MGWSQTMAAGLGIWNWYSSLAIRLRLMTWLRARSSRSHKFQPRYGDGGAFSVSCMARQISAKWLSVPWPLTSTKMEPTQQAYVTSLSHESLWGLVYRHAKSADRWLLCSVRRLRPVEDVWGRDSFLIWFSYAMRSRPVLLILHTSGCSCQEILHKVHLKQLQFLPHEVFCSSSENGLCPPGIPVALAHFLSPKQKNRGINLRAATQMHACFYCPAEGKLQNTSVCFKKCK